MPQLQYDNQRLQSLEGESILDCLLRHGIDFPHSCCAGICQACLIKSSSNTVEQQWQQGLPDTLLSQGYFLACQAKPTSDIDISAPDTSECDARAVMAELKHLSHNVIQIKLLTVDLHEWIPGQYINLINPEGTCRSYSIANIPEDDGHIELHIKLTNNGEMSQWLRKKATTGMTVHIRGSFGKCYYINPNNSAFDMLLAGTGTGLAPLLAIIKSALNHQHDGKITLIHGGYHDDDIYCVETLETLASIYKNFEYIPCVLNTEGRFPQANIVNKTVEQLKLSNNVQVYICGPEETTKQLKIKVFLAGVPSDKIYSDTFL